MGGSWGGAGEGGELLGGAGGSWGGVGEGGGERHSREGQEDLWLQEG